MSDKNRLLQKLQIADFSAFETALYLDTHNTDQEALAHYAKCSKRARELEEEYIAQFGPLRMGEGDNCKVWSWSQGPWPWEYAAN